MSRQRTIQLRKDVEIVHLTLEHAPAMYRWMCDPAVSRNLGLRTEPSLENTRRWITNALVEPTISPFAVLCDGQHVGNVVLDRIDSYLSSARLSIYIGEESQRGSGVGLTAIYLALSLGFDQLKLHKIWLTVHTRNDRAIRTYINLGFALEGILRDEFWLDGELENVLYMSMLEDDYRQFPVT